jgi:hypothetical protein
MGTRSRRAASRELAELDAQLAELLPTAELEALVGATSGLVRTAARDTDTDTDTTTVSLVTGRPAASARSVLSAQRSNLLRAFARRRALLEDSLSSTEVVELLGAASRQTAHDRLAAGSLLAIKDGGRLRYPIWQFDAEGPDGVVEGLPEVLAELRLTTQLGQISWFVSPKRALGNSAPIDALRAGELDAVLAEARASHTG